MMNSSTCARAVLAPTYTLPISRENRYEKARPNGRRIAWFVRLSLSKDFSQMTYNNKNHSQSTLIDLNWPSCGNPVDYSGVLVQSWKTGARVTENTKQNPRNHSHEPPLALSSIKSTQPTPHPAMSTALEPGHKVERIRGGCVPCCVSPFIRYM